MVAAGSGSAAAGPGREPGAVALESRRILAIGGHDFSRRLGNEALRDFILGLAASEMPRTCLLPTASGDPTEQITAFRRFLADSPCQPSHLSLFRLEDEPVELGDHLLNQDIIYVGGGSMINLLAIWRSHGLDSILVEAWRRGIVLCGQSAGAMCWFEAGITQSRGAAAAVKGLGVLPGSLCVHYHRDPERRRAFKAAVGASIPPGYGLDDQAGLLFRGLSLERVVSGRPGAGAWRVEPAGGRGPRETPLEPDRLTDPRPPIDEISADLAELRRTRALRAAGRALR
jgi:peptidase E